MESSIIIFLMIIKTKQTNIFIFHSLFRVQPIQIILNPHPICR
jgi:hypothetical protein